MVRSMQLNGLCTGGIGSGSIVSDDGYIATNGHVTEVSNQSMIMGLNTQENMNKYIKVCGRCGLCNSRNASGFGK